MYYKSTIIITHQKYDKHANNKETESNHTTTKKSTTHNKNSRDKENNQKTKQNNQKTVKIPIAILNLLLIDLNKNY